MKKTLLLALLLLLALSLAACGGDERAESASESVAADESARDMPESAADHADGSGDFGKSNADAEGIATLEAMQELYLKCYENRTDAYHLFNYEDARDAFGSDGVVWKKTDISWNETKHTYRWETADGADYFNISFELEDGEEWYFSCNFSENVKNNLW